LSPQTTLPTYTISKRPSRVTPRATLCTPVPTTGDIKNFYKLKKVIGSGHFGTVRLASPVHSQAESFAVKIIDKAKLMGELTCLRREIQVLADLTHPNIIKYYDVYEDDRYFSIVTEYCCGGDLFEKICSIGHFSEACTVPIMRDIMRAICSLHARGIVHRDIKPSNFLFADNSHEPDLKLIDFGLSNKFGDKFQTLKTIVGTPSYIAPEVLNGSYDSKCDVWSAGVIMFVLLSGNYPFKGENNFEVYKAIRKSKFSFKSETWKIVSDEAKDLLRKMLKKKAAKRLTAQHVLDHPWFSHTEHNSNIISSELLAGLRHFKAKTHFQKEALNVLARRLKRAEIEELSTAFMIIDKDNTGLITIDELHSALEESGFTLAQQEIESIMRNVDFSGDGRIEYADFISASIGFCFNLREEEVWMCFRHFDPDCLGYITADNLDLALKKIGRRFSAAGIHHMIEEADLEQTGVVTFDEFRNMLMAK